MGKEAWLKRSRASVAPPRTVPSARRDGGGGARRARGGGMEGPPPRFRCPPEFEAVSGGGPMGGPQTELWLIRAPVDFCPQSLEGCPVPLHGLERLRPGDNNDNGDNDSDSATTLVLRGGPATPGWHCPLLLSPMSPGGALGCGPPIKGTLSITRSFGTARVALGDTVGTVTPLGTVTPSEGTVPPSEGTVTPLGTVPPLEGTMPPLGTATEGPGPPEVMKRRKKRKKEKREGQE